MMVEMVVVMVVVVRVIVERTVRSPFNTEGNTNRHARIRLTSKSSQRVTASESLTGALPRLSFVSSRILPPLLESPSAASATTSCVSCSVAPSYRVHRIHDVDFSCGAVEARTS